MVEVNGLVNSVQRIPRGSELVAAAALSATTLLVDSVEDFDDAGGDLEINGVRYEYLSCDLEAASIVLATGLTEAGVVGDGVYVVQGGQVAMDHIAFVSTGEGDDAEVLIPFADRAMWPDGDYLDPVPVVLSGDLENIRDVPGRTPVIDGVVYTTGGDGPRVEIEGSEVRFPTGIATTIPGGVSHAEGPSGIALAISAPLPADVAYRPFIYLFPGSQPAYTGSGQAGGYIEVHANATLLTQPARLAVEDDGLVAVDWTTLGAVGTFSPVSGQTPQCLKDAAGNVHVRGAVNRGGSTTNSVVINLPVGLRPSALVATTVATDLPGQFANLQIATTGAATLTWVSTPSDPTAFRLDIVFSTL